MAFIPELIGVSHIYSHFSPLRRHSLLPYLCSINFGEYFWFFLAMEICLTINLGFHFVLYACRILDDTVIDELKVRGQQVNSRILNNCQPPDTRELWRRSAHPKVSMPTQKSSSTLKPASSVKDNPHLFSSKRGKQQRIPQSELTKTISIPQTLRNALLDTWLHSREKRYRFTLQSTDTSWAKH